MGEVEAQIELILMVVRLHICTQLVERLVVLLFLDMGKFTDKYAENGQAKSLIFKAE